MGARDAERAGKNPPITAVNVAMSMPAPSTSGVVRSMKRTSLNVTKLVVPAERPFSGSASSAPRAPAASPSTAASSTNTLRIVRRRKPSTRSVAISLLRAATWAYIVFAAAKQAPNPIITAIRFPRNRKTPLEVLLCAWK